MSFVMKSVVALLAAILLLLGHAPACAQARVERDGVVLYWGLVPAAIVSEKHALQEMHGVVPLTGETHHLVVALFRRDGQRIADAVVRAQLSETGIVDAPPKYLTPMVIDALASYGQVYSVAKEGPYRFRLWVKLPERSDEIEFAISAWSAHRQGR